MALVDNNLTVLGEVPKLGPACNFSFAIVPRQIQKHRQPLSPLVQQLLAMHQN